MPTLFLFSATAGDGLKGFLSDSLEHLMKHLGGGRYRLHHGAFLRHGGAKLRVCEFE